MNTLLMTTQIVCCGVGIVSASLNIATFVRRGKMEPPGIPPLDDIPSGGNDCCEKRRLIVAPPPHSSSAKTKILDAALIVIRSKGYAATTVDDLCAASGARMSRRGDAATRRSHGLAAKKA